MIYFHLLISGMIVFMVLPSIAHSGEPGAAGASFLKFGMGPRATAMAEAQAAVVDDSTAYHWNPAGLSRLDRAEVAATFNQSFQDTTQQNISLAYPFSKNSTGAVFFRRFSVDPFPALDAGGNAAGSVDASDVAYGFSYGRAVYPYLRLGGTVEAIRETLGPVSDTTVGLNAGTQLNVPWMRRLWFGAAVRHLGDPLKFDQGETPLPRTTVLGLGLQEEFGSSRFTLAMDYFLSSDNHPYSALGMEFVIHRLVAVRSGYRFGPDIENRFRMGFGLYMNRAKLAYSFSPLGPIGTVHRFGFSVAFGRSVTAPPVPPSPLPVEPAAPAEDPPKSPPPPKPKSKPMPTTVPELIQDGKNLYKEGEFEKAANYFGEVLKRDPNNTEALDLMRKSLDRMDYFNVQD